MVIWHHFHYAFRGAQSNRWYERPFISGHESVMLFFVLSGYVLSMAVWRGRQLPYHLYLVRRVTRIYLPYTAALFISAAIGEHFLFSRLQLNGWFHLTWQERITWGVIGEGLLVMPVATLNTAFWSLYYEMQMSLIFPFLCLLISRLRMAGSFLLILIVSLASVEISQRTSDPYFVAESLRYCGFFVMGALLSKNHGPLTEGWKRLGTAFKWLGAAFSFGLYFHFFGILKGGGAVRLGLSDQSQEARADCAIALGAVGIVAIATSSEKVQRFLDKPFFEYLGRVSYSMYLLHGTVLFALINLLYGRVSIPVIAAIYFAVTMPLSHLFLIFVEEPSLQWGKRLTSRWGRSA